MLEKKVKNKEEIILEHISLVYCLKCEKKGIHRETTQEHKAMVFGSSSPM